MKQDRPLIGIALMLGFCLLAPLGDALAKILGSTVPLLLLMLVRFAIQFFLLVPFAYRELRLPAKVWGIMALRTLCHLIGVALIFLALRYLPLAETTAIAFVMPFIMLLLGWLFLGEEVGPHRLGAAIAGFLGTLMIVQPSFAEVGWPALLPVGVALSFAVYMLFTRVVAPWADPIVLQTINGLQGTLALLAAALVWPRGLGEDWFQIVLYHWVWLGVLGIIGTTAHLVFTWSLRFVPTSTVAPMQYLELPLAVLIGFVLFGELPNPLATAGIAVTIAAGLYAIHREHLAARKTIA